MLLLLAVRRHTVATRLNTEKKEMNRDDEFSIQGKLEEELERFR